MPENELVNQNSVEEVNQVTYGSIIISGDFLDRIKAIEEESIVAKFVFALYRYCVEIVPNQNGSINYLGVSVDDPTKISYLTYERITLAQSKNEINRIWEDKNYRYHSGAGKVIRKLLSVFSFEQLRTSFRSRTTLNTVIEEIKRSYPDFVEPVVDVKLSDVFSEAEFDSFNNLFRTEGFRQGDSSEIIFVKGHWIKELYRETNYASLSGTLGNSCMRYERTNKYLDIYAHNPSVCKMAVLLNSQGKVQARALVWTVDGVDYHDRIYYTSDLIHDRMKAFFLTKNIKTCASQYSGWVTIKIEADELNKDFDKRVILNHDYYPYMDNMKYLSEDCEFLTNDESLMYGDYKILNCTDGSYEATQNTTRECDYCGAEASEDDLVYIHLGSDRNCGETICRECAVYSEVYSEYITAEDAIYLEGRETYAFRSDCFEDFRGNWGYNEDLVELVDGRYADKDDDDLRYYEDGDAFIIDHRDFEYVYFQDKYYKVDDCVEDRNGDLYPKQYTTEYQEEIWLTTELEEHLNLNLI